MKNWSTSGLVVFALAIVSGVALLITSAFVADSSYLRELGVYLVGQAVGSGFLPRLREAEAQADQGPGPEAGSEG